MFTKRARYKKKKRKCLLDVLLLASLYMCVFLYSVNSYIFLTCLQGSLKHDADSEYETEWSWIDAVEIPASEANSCKA